MQNTAQAAIIPIKSRTNTSEEESAISDRNMHDENMRAEHIKAQEVRNLQGAFKKELSGFLDSMGVPADSTLKITPSSHSGSKPAFIVTGASFTAYDAQTHGDLDTHAFAAVTGRRGEAYLMNNTAAIFERLIASGENVVLHTKSPAIAKELLQKYKTTSQVEIVSGELSGPDILKDIYAALENISAKTPISEVRMALYQSFAQNNGAPFKPMHRENPAEVERAANNRIRFIYNMAAMGYDLIMNREQKNLRIISLSALAATRATYGLLADSTDKFMNECAWRTFHMESNISTGRPVSVYQINPGITTAGDVYKNPNMREVVKHESIADGFPLEDDVFLDKKDLPQISSHDIAWIADSLLRTPDNSDPNTAMPERVRSLLYGGFAPEELSQLFRSALQQGADGSLEIDPDRTLPEHILTPLTSYGKLPDTIKAGDYRRISISPPGQKF